MSQPLPPEFVKRSEHRAPHGFGMLVAFCGSAVFWTLAVVVTLWLR